MLYCCHVAVSTLRAGACFLHTCRSRFDHQPPPPDPLDDRPDRHAEKHAGVVRAQPRSAPGLEPRLRKAERCHRQSTESPEPTDKPGGCEKSRDRRDALDNVGERDECEEDEPLEGEGAMEIVRPIVGQGME